MYLRTLLTILPFRIRPSPAFSMQSSSFRTWPRSARNIALERSLMPYSTADRCAAFVQYYAAADDLNQVTYTQFDIRANTLRNQFLAEAEEHLATSHDDDSLMRLATFHVLAFASQNDGNETKAGSYLKQGHQMVAQMDTFCQGQIAKHRFSSLAASDARAHAHTAWGIFCFYR